MSDSTPTPPAGQPAFATTRWTLVLQARGDAPEARAALGDLCDAYRQPVVRFLRREGRNEDQAEECAQAFLTHLLTCGGVAGVEPGLGRFRSYLLGALKHFLADAHRRDQRLKRGGGAVVQSIERDGGTETSPGMQIPDPNAQLPDAYFDRQWALALMERGLASTQCFYEDAGKADQFGVLKPWLMGDGENLIQGDAASRLGLSAGAVKVAIHRLRKRFRESVQAEVRQTVHDPAEVTEELRYLVEVLSQTSDG